MKRTLLVIAAVILVALPVVAWTQVALLQFIWPLFLSQLSWLLGIVGFVFFVIQFILSGRIPLVERGVGLDRLFVAHRLSGIMGLALILTHAVSRTLFELIRSGTISLGLWKIVGVLAFLIAAVAGLAALGYRRVGLRYESWKRIHLLNYLVLPAAFVHSLLIGAPTLGSVAWLRVYWWALLAVYVLVVAYRLGRRAIVRSRPYTVREVQHENHDVTTLSLDGPQLFYRPGQFMFVNVAIGGRLSEPHPYTIASSPDSRLLRLSAKAIGDFSAALRTVEPGASAFVDGPFGEFTFLNDHPDSIVFVAGGIGITPFLSQLRYMHDRALDIQVTLIWGNKTSADRCFGKELTALADEMESLSVVHVMSDDANWDGERGYITAALIERVARPQDGTHLYLCGPALMMSSVTADLRAAGFAARRIHQEQFAL